MNSLPCSFAVDGPDIVLLQCLLCYLTVRISSYVFLFCLFFRWHAMTMVFDCGFSLLSFATLDLSAYAVT